MAVLAVSSEPLSRRNSLVTGNLSAISQDFGLCLQMEPVCMLHNSRLLTGFAQASSLKNDRDFFLRNSDLEIPVTSPSSDIVSDFFVISSRKNASRAALPIGFRRRRPFCIMSNGRSGLVAFENRSTGARRQSFLDTKRRTTGEAGTLFFGPER